MRCFRPFAFSFALLSLFLSAAGCTSQGQERAQSWYEQGLRQLEAGDPAKAVVSLMQAQKAADNTSDTCLQANIQQAMGNAYSKNYLFEDALACYDKAEKGYEAVRDTASLNTLLYAKARTFNNLKRYPDADSLFIRLARNRSLDSVFLAKVFADMALMKVAHEQEYRFGQIYYNYAVNLRPSFSNFNHWGAYAYALEQTGYPAKADMLLENLEKRRADSLLSTLIWKGRILAHRGAYQEAAACFDAALKKQSENLNKVLHQSALRTQRDYFENSLLHARRENRMIRIIIVLFFLLLMAAVYVGFILLRRRQEQARVEEQALLEASRQLTQQVASLQEDRARLQAQYAHIQQSHFKEMGALLKTALGENETNIDAKQLSLFVKAKRVMDEIRADSGGEQSFEEKLNECFDQVMARLREEIPNHTEEYYRFAGFVFAGFDNQTLMALTGTRSLDSVYAKKKRLRQDIAASSAPHKEQFQHLL